MLLGALALGALNLPGAAQAARTPSPASPTRSPPWRRSPAPIPGGHPADHRDQPRPTGGHDARRRAAARRGVASAERGRSGGGWTEISVIARGAPQSAGETADHQGPAGGPRRLVRRRPERPADRPGQDTNARDRLAVVPIVLASVLLILVLLLRSLVAPLLLVAAVVAVWGAALGIGGLVFGPVFGLRRHRPGLGAAVLRVPGRPRRRLRHLPDAPDAGGVPVRRRPAPPRSPRCAPPAG